MLESKVKYQQHTIRKPLKPDLCYVSLSYCVHKAHLWMSLKYTLSHTTGETVSYTSPSFQLAFFFLFIA